MIIVTGHIVTRPETTGQATELCIAHSQRSRAEPGCIGHTVHADCENPARLVFIEYWADLDALKAHFGVPESVAFVSAVRALAAEPTVMNVFAADEVRPA